jgi:pimeloyl-ACP methyl ester carboxylesterase
VALGKFWRAAAVMLAAAAPPAKGGADVASDLFTHPQQLVAVGDGRHLNLFCVGSGTPTVVFEAGLGASMSTWRHVQGRVASFTRACAYDRAGLGFSDAPGRTADATNIVDDLQSLIVAAPIATPIVLVGHSIGGLYATLFAAMHKDEVAGMVLVDPSFAHQWEDFTAKFTDAERGAQYGRFRAMTDAMRACRALIATADPAKPANAKEAARVADCLPSASDPDHPDPILLAALTQQWRRASQNDAVVSEAENFMPTTEGGGHPAADDDELDSASGNLGSMPLVVMTAGHTMSSFPGLTDAQRAQFAAAWTEGHDALARRSTQGRNVEVASSGHNIQYDQPEAVVDAIRWAVNTARAVVP